MKINNISFAYNKTKGLLNGLTLHLEPGHIYGLLGQNGAGKTTLLKIIAGLCFVESGECEVMGFNPAKRAPAFLQTLFFMPESFNLPAMSAKAYCKYYSGFYPHFDKALFESALAAFGLAPTLQLNKQSHGQKKMFLISFALATRASLLILDEPTNGLDIPNKQVWQGLIAKEIGANQTVIISTHQVHDVAQLIDSVLIMKEGKMLINATVAALESKLHFGQQAQIPAANSVLYAEPQAGGYGILSENTQGSDSALDLTLLFNAAINNIQVAQIMEEKSHV